MSLLRSTLRLRALTTRSPIWLTAFGFAFLGLSNFCAFAADDDPWLDVINTRYTAASHKFEKLAEASPDDTRLTVAYAASLLTRDPMTRVNVRTSRSILIDLLPKLPISDTHYRPLVLLLLGRIDHDHAEPVQFESARAFYKQLTREYPQHPLADQAAVQLMLLAYLESPVELSGEMVPQIEAILPTVFNKSHRFRLRGLASRIYLERLKDEAAAISHLTATQEEGAEHPSIDLHIAYLARRSGQLETAAKRYRIFADGSPRDNRTYTARRIAQEIEEEIKASTAVANPAQP